MELKDYLTKKKRIEEEIFKLQEQLDKLEKEYDMQTKKSVLQPKNCKDILNMLGYSDKFKIRLLQKESYDGAFDDKDFSFEITMLDCDYDEDEDCLKYIITLDMGGWGPNEEGEEVAIFESDVFEIDTAYQDHGSEWKSWIADSDSISFDTYYDYDDLFKDTLKWLCEYLIEDRKVRRQNKKSHNF